MQRDGPAFRAARQAPRALGGPLAAATLVLVKKAVLRAIGVPVD